MGSFLTLLRAFALEPLLWILILGLYAIHLGASGLGSPMETLYLKIAKEIVLTGQWSPLSFNYHAIYSQPPLFPWMMALSMKVFGISLWAARFPALLAGMTSILLAYFVSLKLFNNRITALITSTLLAATWGYFQATHLALPASLTTALLLGSFGVFHTWFPLADRPKLFHTEKHTLSLLQGVLLGFLFLTVGWLGLAIPILAYGCYLLLTGNSERLFGISWPGLLLGFVLIALPWPLWLALQSGSIETFWQFLTASTASAIDTAPLPFMSNLLHLFLLSLPTGFFLVAWAIDHRNGARTLSRQENMTGFLLVTALIGLLAYIGMGATGIDGLGSFVLLPTVLLMGYYLGWVMETGDQSKPFTLTTDLLIVLLIFSSVILTFFIFQILPDDYIDGFWQLPGPSVLSKLWIGKEITLPNIFPLWKLWLLPGPLILLAGGVFMYFCSMTQRTHQVPIALMATTLCFFLFVRLAFLPIFQRPLFEDFAKQLNKKLLPTDTVLLVYRSVPQTAQTLFFLNTRASNSVSVTAKVTQLTPAQLQPKPGQHLYGVISESDYYQMPAESRQQLHIMAHNWIWKLPTAVNPKNKSRYSDTTPYQEEILVFEAMPALPTAPEMPTPFLHNSSL